MGNSLALGNDPESSDATSLGDVESYKARVINSTDEDFRQHYRLQRTIGDGTSASVHRATNILTKEPVAVKVIQKKMLERDSANRVANELKAWRQLKHPNICQLYEVYSTPTTLYFVCELAENGDLLEFINHHGFFKEKQAHRVFAQVLSAVEHCHLRGIVHRDMKLENILIDKAGNAKLTDFGFAGFFDPDEYNPLHEWCGSPPYAAPEIFLGSPYSGPEIDVWSLGVVLFAMCTGTLPFLGDNFELLMAQVLEGKFEVPFFVTMGCENLIRQMVCLDIKSRTTITEIKKHSWLAGAEGLNNASSPERKIIFNDAVNDINAGIGAVTFDGNIASRRLLFEAETETEGSECASSLSGSRDSAAGKPSADLSGGSSLLLFDCSVCDAPSSARWDFSSRSSGVCSKCQETQN